MMHVRPFRIRYQAGREVSSFILSAACEADARRAFVAFKVPGVRVLSVECAEEPGASSVLLPPKPSVPPSPASASALPHGAA
jgi:hypothetical protein